MAAGWRGVEGSRQLLLFACLHTTRKDHGHDNVTHDARAATNGGQATNGKLCTKKCRAATK